jgi:hypothetical protein
LNATILNEHGLGCTDLILCVQDQRYTAWYDKDGDNTDDGTSAGENSAIDHILVSKNLWDLVTEVDIIHEAPAGVSGEALSDHWPLIVTFGTPGQFVRASAPGEVGLIGGAQGTGKDAWIWVGWSALVTFILLIVGL